MTTSGRGQLAVVLVIGVLVVSALTNYKRAVMLRDALDAQTESGRQADEALRNRQDAILSLAGVKLQWPELDEVTAIGGFRDRVPARVVLVLSDLSCVAMRDKEVQLANDLAERFGVSSVVGIVSANHRRYAAAFARVNTVKFPVLFDAESRFRRLNAIELDPLVLVIDEQDRVLFASTPSGGEPALRLAVSGVVERFAQRLEVVRQAGG